MVLDFGLISSGLFPSSDVSGEGMSANSDTIIWNDVGIGIVPIGSIVAWCKDLAGVPALLPSFVECNGQVIADADSPLNGQTIPNLNASGGGTQRFLRATTASGTTGGTDTHSHTIYTSSNNFALGGIPRWNSSTSSEGTLPSYYTVVWVMRIK